MLCTFCNNERDLVAEGPDLAICATCVAAATSSTAVPSDLTCSFCRRGREIALVSPSDNAQICSDCVKIAQEVVRHKASA